MPASAIRTRGESAAPHARAKSNGGAGLFLIVVLAMLAIGGGIFALIYFLGESPKTDNEMLAFLPPDSSLVVSIDFDELAKTEKLRRLEEALPGSDPEVFALIDKADLRRSVVNMTVGIREFYPRVILPPTAKGPGLFNTRNVPPEGDPASVVFRTRQPVDKAKLIAAWSGRESKKGDKTYYLSTLANSAGLSLKFFFPTDTLIVFTRNEKVLEKIIVADPGKPAISDELLSVVKRVSRGPIWFAMKRKLLIEKTYNEIKDEGACPFLTDDTIEAIKHLESIGGWLKLDGDRVGFTVDLTCDDSAIATRVTESAKQLVQDLRTVAINDNPKIAAYRKKYPTRIVSPPIWDACYEVQRTAKVGMNGYAIEIRAECNADGLVPLLVEMTTVKMPPVPAPPKGLPIGVGPGKGPGKK
jgi:hypothetical protein